MKQHTVYVILALIIGALALGVAYAALSDQTLIINGTATATANEDNFDVKFQTASGTGKAVASVDGTDSTGRTATMTVTGLTDKDETASATFTVLNDSPVATGADALINAAISGQTNTTWFEVTTDWEDDTVLAPGASEVMTVTVRLKDSIVEEDQSETFRITLTAQPQ